MSSKARITLDYDFQNHCNHFSLRMIRSLMLLMKFYSTLALGSAKLPPCFVAMGAG
jgi:hypothetical protein